VLNGISKKPNQQTDGEGAVQGAAVTCDAAFTTPFSLPADHYFFVPQVSLGNGEFYWLSAPRPITGGSGAFVGDLQTWIRSANLDPDGLRVGTDIVRGVTAPTFNAAFSLHGDAAPEPATDLLLLIAAAAGVPVLGSRRSARPA